MTIFQADVVRIVAGICAGWSLIMTVAILFAFFSHVGWGIGWRDIMARKKTHILLVSVAFVVISVYGVVELMQRIGTPLTWRGPVLLFVFVLSSGGQFSMLTAQMAERRRSLVAVEPVAAESVLSLIERVVMALDRIEGRQVTNEDSMARMKDAAGGVAHELLASQERADKVRNGEPGAAADAGAQSGNTDD